MSLTVIVAVVFIAFIISFHCSFCQLRKKTFYSTQANLWSLWIKVQQQNQTTCHMRNQYLGSGLDPNSMGQRIRIWIEILDPEPSRPKLSQGKWQNKEISCLKSLNLLCRGFKKTYLPLYDDFDEKIPNVNFVNKNFISNHGLSPDPAKYLGSGSGFNESGSDWAKYIVIVAWGPVPD